MYCQQTETCLNHIENLLNIEEKLKKLVFDQKIIDGKIIL